MCEEPLISVIIPVYNVFPYIREAIDSVIHQTWKNLEMILVDDGSTDGSGEVCDEYAEKDVRIKVVHQDNRGLSEARNTGLDYMTGEYVAFLDSDDAFHPEMIEQLYSALNKKYADLAICECESSRTKGCLTEKRTKKKTVKKNVTVLSNRDALYGLMNSKFTVLIWDKLYKKQLWNEIRFPAGRVYEDISTMPCILKCCNSIVKVPQVLVYHRRRSNSISETYSSDNVRDYFIAGQEAQGYLKRIQPPLLSTAISSYSERLLRTTIYLWAILRKRDCTSEVTDALKRDILKSNDQTVSFRSSKTIIVWQLFFFFPDLLIPVFKSFHAATKTIDRIKRLFI